MVSAERLAQLDEELATLGKTTDEVQEVVSRVGGNGPSDLGAVDADLDSLAADLQGAGELLARAAERTPAVVGTFERGAAERGSGEAGAADTGSADDELFQEAPWGEGGREVAEAAPADEQALSADSLFEDTEASGPGPDAPLTADPSLSEPPPPAPEPASEDFGDGLADLLEGEEDGGTAASASKPDGPAGEEAGDGDEEIEVLEADEFELLVEDEDLDG